MSLFRISLFIAPDNVLRGFAPCFPITPNTSQLLFDIINSPRTAILLLMPLSAILSLGIPFIYSNKCVISCPSVPLPRVYIFISSLLYVIRQLTPSNLSLAT